MLNFKIKKIRITAEIYSMKDDPNVYIFTRSPDHLMDC